MSICWTALVFTNVWPDNSNGGVCFEAVCSAPHAPHLLGTVSEQSLLSFYTGGMKKKMKKKTHTRNSHGGCFFLNIAQLTDTAVDVGYVESTKHV